MNTVLRQRIQRIERLVDELKNAPDPQIRSGAIELVQTLMEFHGSGLERMMELVATSGDAGLPVIENFGQDEIVGNMLLLHGLHPIDIETRVLDALEKVRPYLNSHNGDVQLLGIDNGAVRLRLVGTCNGCPSSALTMKSAIEKAVYEAAPDVVAIGCEGASDVALA